MRVPIESVDHDPVITAHDSDEFAATIAPAAETRLDKQAAPVFDESQMSKLVALMGPEWVAKNQRNSRSMWRVDWRLSTPRPPPIWSQSHTG